MEQIGKLINLQKQTGLTPQSNGQLPTAPISEDSQGRVALALMLQQCFQALNLFGKEPEQIEAAINIHQMVLAPFSIDQIRTAFSKWLETHDTFPAPANIVSLIRRGGRPPLSEAVYVSISKKPADQRTKDDWRYLSDYEDYIRKGDW